MSEEPKYYLPQNWFSEFQTCVYDHEKATQYAHIERQPRPVVTLTGEPTSAWPEGAYLNHRTGEVILLSNTFSPPFGTRPTIQRGYLGTTETETQPDDRWVMIGT